MMSKFVFALCLCVASSSILRGENLDVNTFLGGVVDSFNNQDCQLYSSYFNKDSRQKKRRESGLFFASNNAKMKLEEVHVMFEDQSNIEVAVSYSIDNNDHVSKIFLEKEDGEWRISKEVFVKGRLDTDTEYAEKQQNGYESNPFSARSLPPQQQSCPGGVCGGGPRPFSSLNACREYGFETIPCRKGSCSSK